MGRHSRLRTPGASIDSGLVTLSALRRQTPWAALMSIVKKASSAAGGSLFSEFAVNSMTGTLS